MTEPKPKLDYEAPPKRVRFLEKLNPDATPWSMARRAAINAAGAAVLWLLVMHFNRNFHLPWVTFAALVLFGAALGVVLEWQEPNE